MSTRNPSAVVHRRVSARTASNDTSSRRAFRAGTGRACKPGSGAIAGSHRAAYGISAAVRTALAACIACTTASITVGQPVVGPPQIYSCTDATGKKLTSDRPIVECAAREQRVLNADGSVRRVLPPTLTADERSEVDARERTSAVERATLQDAIRRDRNLLARFPDEAAHRSAREAALNDVHKALRLSESRLVTLANERKPLMDETEFYVGKALPLKLKGQLDANDAAVEAQHTLLQNQRLEVVRVNALYDAELVRLKKLWGGAQPGSMGVVATGGSGASAPTRK